ncbi:MAG: DUF4294 domain-containing protein [Saprospiraceae bacterium]
MAAGQSGPSPVQRILLIQIVAEAPGHAQNCQWRFHFCHGITPGEDLFPPQIQKIWTSSVPFTATIAARRVYAYALQAISLYEQIEEETQDMNRRKRKRYIKHEHKELKEDMTETMKNLSKTEGKVLIKMIESQLDKPFYDIIKSTRGTVTAAYWNTLGKLNGYDLKQGYEVGEDPLLDDVLLDYDFGNPDKLYGG